LITSLLCLFLAVGCGPDAKQSIAPDLLVIAADPTIHAESIEVPFWVLNWSGAPSATTTLTVLINDEPNWEGASLWAGGGTVPPIDPEGWVEFSFDVPFDQFDADSHYYGRASVEALAEELPGNRYNRDFFGFSLDASSNAVVRCSPDPPDDGQEGASDPLVAEQWHLNNIGQRAYAFYGGVAGEDLGMASVLTAETPSGDGVRLAILDTGLELCHPDLATNVEKGASINFRADTSYGADANDPFLPSSFGDHGTSVAGVAAAAANNGTGGRGVAPTATLLGYNVLAAPDFLRAVAGSLGIGDTGLSLDTADIFNMSFGSLASEGNIDPTVHDLYRYGVGNLRSGRGAIFVKSAGNGFGSCHSMVRPANARVGCAGANGDATNNIPQVIVVGAFNAAGVKASYSSVGANLWISAPAGEFGHQDPAILTADQVGTERGYDALVAIGVVEDSVNNAHGNYVSTFNGTSAAAPNASGAIALLLESYPELTWRDVKHILASTARRIHADADPVRYLVGGTVYTLQLPWVTNAAGYDFHNWYGFGAIHVDDALEFAASHVPNGLGEFTETGTFDSDEPVSIPDADGRGVTQTLTVEGLADDANIEAVVLHVSIQHPQTNDLGIHLTSPAGTETIVNPIFNEPLAGNADLYWDLLANAFYGESANGEWTIRVVDAAPGDAGTLDRWNLRFFLGTHP